MNRKLILLIGLKIRNKPIINGFISSNKLTEGLNCLAVLSKLAKHLACNPKFPGTLILFC
jgi:hypothetical protein